MKLTPKQEMFCQEYTKCGNASEAYRNSYNAENMKTQTIAERASRLLKEYKIGTRVKELQQKTSEKHNITREWIINELQWVIENAKYQEKIDTSGINKAVDTLNKMFGYYAAEKVEHSGKLDINTLTSRLVGK